MPVPQLDPLAPRPRIHPGLVAALLAVIAILGAIAIYAAGNRGLERDRASIQRFFAAIETQTRALESTVAELERIDAHTWGPYRRVLSGYDPSSFPTPEPVPDVVEPYWSRLVRAFEQVIAIRRAGPELSPSEIDVLVAQARATLDEAALEREELLCLARIAC